MSRLRGVLNTNGELTTGTSELTLIQIIAPTNHCVVVEGFGISFDGISSTAAPIIVKLSFQSGEGTSAAELATKSDGSRAETLLTLGRDTFSAEPTEVSIIRQWNVHPQSGIDMTFDLDEIIMGSADRVGLVVTSAEAVNALAYIKFEE